jgi:hypothetical protein
MGCSPGLLSGVRAETPLSSPAVRSLPNRLAVRYHLSTAATVSSRVQSTDGQQWQLFTDAARPLAGDYLLEFDGSVPGPGRSERRVLPDGTYQLVIDATSGPRREQAVVPVTIQDADTSLPETSDLSVLPDHISPNFDAVEDVTHITYQLAKTASVQPFLDRVVADGTRQRVWMGEPVDRDPGAQDLVWDGLANGEPVANGAYELGIRARDTAGNIVERAQPLTVEDAGAPEASITTARIGPRQVIRGGQVCLDAVVRNTGQTVLRTEGPEPGYVYDSLDTYSSIENHRFTEQAGFWRVGLSWAGSPDTNGATYPYRWGFGHDVRPGEEVLVHGCVAVNQPQDKLVFFAGLVQENMAIHNAGAGLVRVDVSS